MVSVFPISCSCPFLYLVLKNFFVIFFTANIFGSIISSTILNQRDKNTTVAVDSESLSRCGKNDCPYYNTTNPNLRKPASHVVSLPISYHQHTWEDPKLCMSATIIHTCHPVYNQKTPHPPPLGM